MFTVLIAEKKHIDAIRQVNKLFFEPFLENDELAFCCWNPDGKTLYEAVPDLSDIVGRKKKWKAVIIHNPNEIQLKQQNPFDVVDGSSLFALQKPTPQPDENESWDDWEDAWKAYYCELTKRKELVCKSALETPLTRLSGWLCFRPSDFILNDVPENESEQELLSAGIGEDNTKPSARLEAIERRQYRIELRMKENLRRESVQDKFLNIAYPAEVYCISERTKETGFFDPESFWTIRSDLEYSGFCDRNMYYDKMRFMVFDVFPASHRDYRCDRIRFLYTVLIFAVNDIPGSALQARRLYLLDSETNDKPLCTLVTSYDRKLAGTYERIETEIEKIRSEIPGELSDKEAESLFCTPTEIPVTLAENCDTDPLFADFRIGLSADCPQDEHEVWSECCRASQKTLTYLVKQQERVVKKSVDRLHNSVGVSDGAISRLNSFQMDDIRDCTESAEDEMVTSLPPDIGDSSKYTERIEKKKAKVREIMDSRMGKKATISLGLTCLGLYALCFLPFLISNYGSSSGFSRAGTIALSMVIGLAVALLVTLFRLRAPLKAAIRSFNREMEDTLDDIKLTMKKYSDYLTAVCTARRGYTVLNYSEKNPDIYTKSVRIRKKHQADIRRKRAFLSEEYHDFISVGCCDYAMSQPYDYDFGKETEYAYPAPFLSGDCIQIDFLENGNRITVPSSYITGIFVRMEGIYDE